MPGKNVRTALGALTGLVSLVAMVRLVAGAFNGGLPLPLLGLVLLVLVLWIVYAAWRARHGRLGARGALAVLALDAVGALSVWWLTVGPVLALVCSFAAFVVVWVHDWPPRRPRGEDSLVRIEDLYDEAD